MTGAQYLEFDAYLTSVWPKEAELDDDSYEINGKPFDNDNNDCSDLEDDPLVSFCKNNPNAIITICSGDIGYAPSDFPSSLTTCAKKWMDAQMIETIVFSIDKRLSQKIKDDIIRSGGQLILGKSPAIKPKMK
jgi:hypothetical protein